ncbi:hypothetical protein BDR04DRAFT_1152960 [Suillus decipiens]|nr:hypothetical protein BDR04DRAFT_1152960 [Suillus decipiens]
MASSTTVGMVKTADACHQKWVWMHSTFHVIDRLAHYSGILWSTEHGANITAKSETVWTDIIKNYKTKGWAPYEKLCEILPSKAEDGNAYHALMPFNLETSLTTTPATSFCDLDALEQSQALDDLENTASIESQSDNDIMMMPPPFFFDVSCQSRFTPSTPGASSIILTLATPAAHPPPSHSSSTSKCKDDGDDTI